MVSNAEHQAAARIEEAREALPAFLKKQRESRMAAMEAKATQLAAEEERRALEVEERARASLDAAADYIVSLVWPGDRTDASGAKEARL